MFDRRDFLIAAGVAGVGAAFATDTFAEPSGRPGDVLLVNGKVVTMDPSRPRAEAVLVRGGRVAFVGSNADARQRSRGLAPVDLGGRTLLPGFVEGHTHFEIYIQSQAFHTQIPRSLKNFDEVFAVLREAAAKAPKGQWIFGRGYFNLEGQLAEQRLPSRQELDDISTDHPIILCSSVHVASLNTPALKQIRLWSPEDERALRWKDGTPRTGTHIARDANGVPTGVVTEMFDLVANANLYPEPMVRDAYERYNQSAYLAAGMTTVCNITGAREHIQFIKDMQNAGRLPLRFRDYYTVPMVTSIEDMQARRLSLNKGDDMQRAAGVKMFVDGAGQDSKGNRIEDFKWTEEALTREITRSHQMGLPVLLHAVTPGGLNRALNAIAGARANTGRKMRDQIHHISFISDAGDMRRLRELGVTAGMTRADKGRGQEAKASYRGMLDAGVQVICVADPAGSFPHFSAWEGIGSLVAPISEGGVLGEGRRLTVDEALRSWTTQPAYTNYQEDHLGAIAPGKLADFQVVSQDPWMVEPGALFDTKVEEVYLGGRSVFTRSRT
jgi:predicted amidohydrolase YtcJ